MRIELLGKRNSRTPRAGFLKLLKEFCVDNERAVFTFNFDAAEETSLVFAAFLACSGGVLSAGLHK